jgi:hypothetical protein
MGRALRRPAHAVTVLALRQTVPTPLKHLTRAGLPQRHFIEGNIVAALAAGMSWFFAATTGWPQTLQAEWSIVRRGPRGLGVER